MILYCLTSKSGLCRFLLICLLLNSLFANGQLVINEICSSNDALLYDFEDNSSDWIELFNYSDQPIYLGDLYLSDNINDVEKWQFPPDTLPPMQFQMIFASGKNSIYNKEIHTNFKLSSHGEILVLSNDQGQIIDSVSFGSSPKNYSYARLPDFTGKIKLTSFTSPFIENEQRPHVFISKKGGFYKEDVEVSFEMFGDPVELRYTMNGNEPTRYSLKYEQKILFSSRNLPVDTLALIPTTPMEGPDRLNDLIWKTPSMECKKAHILRYALFNDSVMVSPVFTQSYFIDAYERNQNELPIISIVTDPEHLFNYEKGIYVPGQRFDNEEWHYWPKGNYHNKGDGWERKINFEYFNQEGSILINNQVGMRIHGHSSATFPQKSFKLYFRKEYGLSSFNEKVFDKSETQEFKSLIFRNGGNDFMDLHFRDVFMQSLLDPLDVETQLSQASIVFINGEYWGLHNIRQRYDDNYFEIEHDVPRDSLIVTGSCGWPYYGDRREHSDLIDFISNNDLSVQENYEYIETQIDLDNCMQYYLANIYFANSDWPSNNYKMWKTTGVNSKWRWLVYDLDLSYAIHYRSQVYKNAIEEATLEGGTVWPNKDCATILFRNLLKNEGFKTNLLQVHRELMQTVFEPQNVIGVIDSIVQIYESEMSSHIKRWNYPVSSDNWYDGIENIKDFASNRPAHMRAHFREYFGAEFYDSIVGVRTRGDFNSINIYPNPSKGDVNIELPHQDPGITSLLIYNTSGVKVFEKSIEDGVGNVQLNLNSLPDGVYVITAIIQRGFYRSRFSIMR